MSEKQSKAQPKTERSPSSSGRSPPEAPPANDQTTAATTSDDQAMPASALEEIKAKAAKADEHWDRFVRLTADFDNFRKRAARERADAVRYANEALVEKLLPVMDNLDAATNAANNAQSGSTESLRAGVAMVLTQLRGVLVEAGLEELDALNRPFDPTWQEALSQHETADAPEGNVVQQLRKGYKLRERLIRPASVIVAKKRG